MKYFAGIKMEFQISRTAFFPYNPNEIVGGVPFLQTEQILTRPSIFR